MKPKKVTGRFKDTIWRELALCTHEEVAKHLHLLLFSSYEPPKLRDIASDIFAYNLANPIFVISATVSPFALAALLAFIWDAQHPFLTQSWVTVIGTIAIIFFYSLVPSFVFVCLAFIALSFITKKIAPLLEPILPAFWRALAKLRGGRPNAEELKLALIEAIEQNPRNEWTTLKRRLNEATYDNPKSADEILSSYRLEEWEDVIVARCILCTLGGEAVGPLVRISNVSPSTQKAVSYLVEAIAAETKKSLKYQASHLFCPKCLVGCGPIRVLNFIYYGCRNCGKTEGLIPKPTEIIAALDTKMKEPILKQGDKIIVNWLKLKRLFDFDRVEILDASDEDVERFCIQVGNDTNPLRNSKYHRIPCSILSECSLSHNLRKSLAHLFGKVSTEQCPTSRTIYPTTIPKGARQ